MFLKMPGSEKQTCKVIVALSKYIEGSVDHFSISDGVGKKLPRYIREGSKVKCRILFVEKEQKVLKLTLKPTMISEDLAVLKDYNNIDLTKEYYGTIVSENTFGFTISFFNEITGFLTFNDIENQHNISRQTFQIG